MKGKFNDWLTTAYHVRASDVHLTIGKPPVFRINGKLEVQDQDVLMPQDTYQIVKEIVSEDSWKQLETNRDLDFTYGINGVSRFRINTFFQRGQLSLAIRLVPRKIPTVEELGLPNQLKEFLTKPQGLILVTGPTGSGKSTTLATMIDYMNRTMHRHIITLEDPIEYMHKHDKCVIDQREIGFDINSFAAGLRSSLRQDPDVILVGEMRDLETISTAVTAAETGHLVLGTLHTTSAVSTIERIIDVFPSNQQTQIQIQLSSILNSVISQRLFVTKEQTGRVVATELLVNNSAVKNLIRNDKLYQVQNVLQTSRDSGMHTLEMDLKRLLQEDLVTYESITPFLQERNL
ncbi:type IV pilus twitching motility protein PilT [Virgibacillus flavescens]|uniref:type IV pilus twitching motility protein PilT n=1 Tax=Virgibacillus flavescens TaxID=1611422 RepID=UPI003D346D1B